MFLAAMPLVDATLLLSLSCYHIKESWARGRIPLSDAPRSRSLQPPVTADFHAIDAAVSTNSDLETRETPHENK